MDPKTDKFLPLPNNVDRPYWDGCQRHQLLVQKCSGCGAYIFYPRPYCPHCLCDDLEWHRTSGKGEVYACTVVHRPLSPAYQDDVPYVVAFVELAEGVRMMSNIVDCDPEDVHIGLKVTVVFTDVTDEITLPQFRPDSQGGQTAT